MQETWSEMIEKRGSNGGPRTVPNSAKAAAVAAARVDDMVALKVSQTAPSREALT